MLLLSEIPECSGRTMTKPAQSLDFSFCTKQRWAHTGVHVLRGHQYKVEVVDMSKVFDWFVPVHNLEGWPWLWARVTASPIAWLRRAPSEPWFALIATVDGTCPERLLQDGIYLAPKSGELVCYFNDTWFSYWNNRGVASLRLVPIAKP